jgi:hypothetical protein
MLDVDVSDTGKGAELRPVNGGADAALDVPLL